ncbi:MAG: SprB repeat-containing protein [Cyclobacteriaceae bacterium]
MFQVNNTLKLFVFCVFALFSCTSVNEDSIAIDCEASDLEITSVSTTPATCSAGGSASINVSGGAGEFTYTIDAQEQSGSDFINLPAGAYTVAVEDGNGCSATANFDISGSDETILATAEVTPSGCDAADGEIVITAAGGSQDFTYSLDNGDFQSDNTFSALSAEEYSITVRDGNGCTAELTVTVGTAISLADNIMPIIEANCAVSGCHKDVRNPLFNSRSDVIQSAGRIAARTNNSANPMPPGGQLPQSDIDDILCWVENGAQDN